MIPSRQPSNSQGWDGDAAELQNFNGSTLGSTGNSGDGLGEQVVVLLFHSKPAEENQDLPQINADFSAQEILRS